VVANIETGRQHVYLSLAVRLATVLDMSLDDFRSPDEEGYLVKAADIELDAGTIVEVIERVAKEDR
jgi:hypothetical protein